MKKETISISLVKSGKSLVLELDTGVSVRKVLKTLSSGEVEVTDVMRSYRQIIVPLTELAKVQEALCDWDMRVDEEVTSKAELLKTKEIEHFRSLEIVNKLHREDNINNLLPDFPEKKYLDNHQIQAVSVASHPLINGICIFDEQGLGKTVTTLFTFHRLVQSGEVGRMLVVCPKNVVYEWIKDNERFFNKTYKSIDLIGSLKEKRRKVDTNADIYITNFETTISLNYRLKVLLEGGEKKSLLVIDESFFVKNPGSKRTQAIKNLRASADRCIVLCGTPAPNSPLDIVEQFNIADKGVAFKDIKLSDEISDNKEKIGRVIKEKGIYIRRLKQDVLPELPNKTFHRVLVQLQPEQERAYVLALKNLITDLRAVDDISFNKNLTSFIAKRFMLLQICSCPDSVIAPYSETPSKLIAIDSILEELITKRYEKVVIWSFFTASIENLIKRYSRYNPVRYDGKVTNVTERKDNIEKFQKDDKTMLFVANPAAAGAGITLHRACYAIYESLPVQTAHYFQSLDRIHRRGQDRDVEYLILLSDKTLEENYYNSLEEKESSSRELLGDVKPNTINRSTMLSELENAAALIGLRNDELKNISLEI